MITNGGTQAVDHGFLPNFCGIRPLFAVVLTAELLALILTLGSGSPTSRFWQVLSQTSLYVQWIAIISTGLLCLLRPQLNRLSNGWAGFCAWLLLMLVTAAVSELVSNTLGQTGQQRWLGPDNHLGLQLKSLGISAIVGLLLLHYLYLQYQHQRQELAESESRLQALQSRIHPHFLFNSMNTIASLTRSNPGLAEEITEDLADLFRVSLGDARRHTTLGDEIDLCRRYLNIEAQRLDERLQVTWELEPELPLNAAMPALILQPLLENAVYHGIEPSPEPGSIHISGCFRRHRINLGIRNTLPASEGDSQRQSHQLAMENIRQRLEVMFHGQASLTESRVDGEYQVRLVFPHPWERP